MTVPAAPGTLAPVTLDTRGVGLYTSARTEFLDITRVLAFSSSVMAEGAAYHDDTRPENLSVHPGIAFTLQFRSQGRPGVVVGRAEDWIGAVHAETDLFIHRPLQLGQVITTQGQLIARKQVRSGVLNVERYRMCDERGELLAEMDFNLMFRGARLAGGDHAIEALRERPGMPEPSGPVEAIALHIDRNVLHHYTACSGIYAPIHTERRVARAAGFPDIILHGSALKSIVLSKLIDRHFGGDPAHIRRLYGQLRAVVPADTGIRIEILATVLVGRDLQVFFRVLNHEGREALAHGIVIGTAPHTV
jgi:acyl dehydratase